MQQDNWKRLGLLMVLVVGMASLGAAADFDSFEDGDYSSNPSWTVTSSSAGGWSVENEADHNNIQAFDGSQMLMISEDGDNDNAYSRIELGLQSSIKTGSTWEYYFHDYFSGTSHKEYITWIGGNSDGVETSQGSASLSVQSTGNTIGSYDDSQWVKFEFNVQSDGTLQVEAFQNGSSIGTASGNVDVTGNSKVEFSHKSTYQNSRNSFFDYTEYGKNQAPQFNSTSVSPDPPLIGENVSYGAEVYDSDGSIDYTNLTVSYGGSTVVSDAQRSGTTPSWNDIFKPSSGNKWLNATLDVQDNKGAVTTKEIDRYLSDNAPNISLNKPVNKTYFTYDVPLDLDVSDSDSRPDEVYSCTVDKDGSQVNSFDLLENGSTSFTGTVGTGLGSHSVNVSCSDGSGNSDNVKKHYSVTDQEFKSQTIPSPVYESKTPQSNLEVKVGDMVQELKADYIFNGTLQNSGIDSVNGVGNAFVTASHSGIPLVQSNNTAVDGYWDYTVNVSDFNSSSYTEYSYNTSNVSQSIYHAVHTPSLSLDQTKYVEKEDAEVTYSYTNKSFEGSLSCDLTFNGSTKSGGCSQFFDSGLVSGTNKESVSASGDATISFDGDSRSVGSKNTNVDVYKKILTDCSNSVNGVTGVKTLTYNLYDEENRSQKLTGNIAYNYDVTHHGEHKRNYAFDKNGVKTTDTCIYPSWADYQVTGPIQYDSESSQNTNGLLYPDRQYNLNNQSINNNTDSVDLYLLDETFTTPVYFEVTDRSGNAVPGVTVSVQRYFVGEDSYITVAKSEADSEGVATTYLRVNEIYYKYTVKNEKGDVLLNTDREILTCQTSPCTKELRVNPKEDSEYFVEKEAFEYSTQKIFNNQGNLTGFQATVSHSGDVFKESTLKVDREKALGTQTICNITSSSNPTTHVCQFNSPAGNDRIDFVLTAKTDNNQYLLDKGIINDPGNLFGDNAYFAAFIIFAMLSSLGLASPKAGIVFSTAGIIVPWYIGFYQLSIGAVASLIVIALVLVAGGRS